MADPGWDRRARGETKTHPPFTSGNLAAVKSGATSPRLIAPLAERLAAELLAERPWLSQHRRTVDNWALAQAQHDAYFAYFDRVGFLDADGEQRPGVDRLDRLASRTQSLLAALGDDPMSMARLLGSLSATATAVGAKDALEALQPQARAFVAAWEQQAIDAGQQADA